jgi:hypothetical protein
VFVEANVKKWGLAPVNGTLAPPPAYGYEAGSLLLERGIRSGEASHLLTNQQQSYQSISTNHTNRLNNANNIPSIIETSHDNSSSSSSSSDDESDDNTPLIQQVVQSNHTSIPIPSSTRQGSTPTASPPSYSTFPRLSLLMGRNFQEENERNRRAGLI